MLNPNHGYGTAEDCIGYVGRLIEAGADEILFLTQMGTIPHDAQMETIRTIGEEVIPYFRSGPGRELVDARAALPVDPRGGTRLSPVDRGNAAAINRATAGPAGRRPAPLRGSRRFLS